MTRGKLLEPVARRLYEGLMGCKVPPVCCHHDEHPWLKASLDGYAGKVSLVVEIKAPNRDDHFKALLDKEVPEKYYWQVMHLLLVTGCRVCHYVSYSPQQSVANQRLAVVPVHTDKQALAWLLAEEKKFWAEVTAGRDELAGVNNAPTRTCQ